ncbi:hypothetical protein ACU4GA_13265 [Methylobacterium oryzae CBMB20]
MRRAIPARYPACARALARAPSAWVTAFLNVPGSIVNSTSPLRTNWLSRTRTATTVPETSGATCTV